MLNIKEFHGRIIDLDTHIQPSPGNYELAGGEVGRNFAKRFDEVIKTLPKDEAEKIIARSTAYLKDKYTTDPVYRERAKGYSKAFRDRQRLLVQEARKIVLENEARQKQAT